MAGKNYTKHKKVVSKKINKTGVKFESKKAVKKEKEEVHQIQPHFTD